VTGKSTITEGATAPSRGLYQQLVRVNERQADRILMLDKALGLARTEIARLHRELERRAA
jgi:hypothetical protein